MNFFWRMIFFKTSIILCKYVILLPKISKIWDKLPNYELFLRPIYFKCTIFLRKYTTISSKIGKTLDFTRSLVLKCVLLLLLLFYVNRLFCLTSTKFAIFVTNCQIMNFFHNWYFLSLRSFCTNTLLFLW